MGVKMTLTPAARTRLTALLVAALATVTTACTDYEAIRKQKVLSEIHDVETEREPVAKQVASRTERLASLQGRAQELQSQLDDYNRRVRAYLMDHKMAVAAILAGVGGTMVLSGDNSFSDDAKAVGGVAAAIALLWALGNMEEVTAVIDALVQADAYVKGLKQQIAQVLSNVRAEQGLLERDRQQLQGLTEKIAALRAQL